MKLSIKLLIYFNKFIKEHRVLSFISIAAFLHFFVYWLWPSQDYKSYDLSMPARVVHLMNLNVSLPEPVKTEKLKIDENKIEIGKTEKEDKKIQKIKKTSKGDSFLPFFMVDTQPHPLIRINEILYYPDNARRLGIQGIVVIELDIDENGRVKNIRIVRKAGWGFDEEVLRKLPKVRFSPAMKDKEPVAVTVRLPIEFKLE